MSIQEQVRSLSYQLRLFGMQNQFEARAREATAQGLQPTEFLLLLLQDEALQRKDRLAKSLITRAKFRNQLDLEDWDQSFERGLSPGKLRELAQLDFIRTQENLILLGRTGEGKTHLASALGKRICQENHSVAFLPINILFEEVLAARTAGKYLGYLKKLTHTQVLIFDDFALRQYTHDEATVLMDILEDRSRKGQVMVTSQVEPEGWHRLFEDPVIAEAIVDRLVFPSQKIILTGGSYRERQAKSIMKKRDGKNSK